MTTRIEKLAEGKTKIIWQDPQADYRVLIEAKPDITAGDGERRDVIEGKDVLATTTAVNVFRLLEDDGIRSHFIDAVDARTFRALKLNMLPIEVVVRRIATGSFLRREPEVAEGTVFDKLKVEFFYKDDARHDPLMVWHPSGVFELYDPKRPVVSGEAIDRLPFEAILPDSRRTWWESGYLPHMRRTAIHVFDSLEDAWSRLGVTLVDFKIEFGFHRYDRRTDLYLGDVIDNDSWRLWPDGDKGQKVDKDNYRELAESAESALADVKKKYAWVAAATTQFTK